MSSGRRIAVLGGGAWGTALALNAVRAGHAVTVWTRDAGLAAELSAGSNRRYLPGIPVEGIAATTALDGALDAADAVLAVVPAQALRDVLRSAAPTMPAGAPLVICAKGIERTSGARMSQIAADEMPAAPLGLLSGPSFAGDLARGLPTAVVIAAHEEARASELAAWFSSASLRCYSSDDITGVELGGALKNVLALAAGAATGAGLGASAQAALVTRGFVELRRLASTFGARSETLMGLSGLGDLVLTCASAQSRNFSYGLALGRGESLAGQPLAEGVATAHIAARLVGERGVEAPIITAVAELLDGRISIRDAVVGLMSRPLKAEDQVRKG